MRILYGLTHADSGSIEVDGRPVHVRSPKDAIGAGVGMVTQHFSLVRPMTVAENLAGSASGMARLDLADGARGLRALAWRSTRRARRGPVHRPAAAWRSRLWRLLCDPDEPTAVLCPAGDALFAAEAGRGPHHLHQPSWARSAIFGSGCAGLAHRPTGRRRARAREHDGRGPALSRPRRRRPRQPSRALRGRHSWLPAPT
jgi:ABC-type Fe3+/spermidine/putrescine transport system ATPase subunit